MLSDLIRERLQASRVRCDRWFDQAERMGSREEFWVRLVAALLTESGGGRVLAHTGNWGSGGWINEAQKKVLAGSAALRKPEYAGDGFGSNGGSVGDLQQIPTEVARLRTRRNPDGSEVPWPWDGWGPMEKCLDPDFSQPKFLDALRITSDPVYKGKLTASPIVADLLRVQQPLAEEVAVNYGTDLVARAEAVAALFPRVGWWPTWFPKEK